jgi:hypothetical protein
MTNYRKELKIQAATRRVRSSSAATMDNSVGRESVGIEAATISPPRMRCAAPRLDVCTLYPAILSGTF